MLNIFPVFHPSWLRFKIVANFSIKKCYPTSLTLIRHFAGNTNNYIYIQACENTQGNYKWKGTSYVLFEIVGTFVLEPSQIRCW
jgi:hypothetical protein